MYLQDGVAERGQRILPEGWVAYSARLTPQSADEYGYGAGFWTQRGNSAAARAHIAAGFPADSFMAKGSQGQYTIVVPSHDLVIVKLGWAYTRMTTTSRSSAWSGKPWRRCNWKNDATRF